MTSLPLLPTGRAWASPRAARKSPLWEATKTAVHPGRAPRARGLEPLAELLRRCRSEDVGDYLPVGVEEEGLWPGRAPLLRPFVAPTASVLPNPLPTSPSWPLGLGSRLTKNPA